MNSILKKRREKSVSQDLKTWKRLCNLALSELKKHKKGCLQEYIKYMTVTELLNAKIDTKVKTKVVKIPQNSPKRLLYLFFCISQ